MSSQALFLKNSLRFCLKKKIKTSLDNIDNLGHLIQDFFLIFRIKNLLKAFSNSPFLDLNLIQKVQKDSKKRILGRLSGLKFDSLFNFISTCIEMLTKKIQKSMHFICL